MTIPEEKLKELLLQIGLLDEKGYLELTKYATNAHTTFEKALVEKNIISEENFAKMIANYVKIPFVSLSHVSIPQDLVHIVPERMARHFHVIPFERTPEGIKLAMTNPQDTLLQAQIAKKTGAKIIPYLATDSEVRKALQIYKTDLQKTFDELLQGKGGVISPVLLNDAPVTKLVDMLVEYAYREQVSDIHIEPEEERSLVRFRIDGILHDVLLFPKNLHDRIITRIKVLSRLRTDEHLASQDGKMRIQMEEENLDIRVSILPIVDVEKIVLRLLASQSRQFSLTDLGMNETDLQKVTKAYGKSYGMILSTGPTGSGKSTSIYAILKILNIREKNITTIEDPVEYRIKGVNQIQVNPKTNLTFASGLRSILRQDPNIVMVGEIRDSETAGIAVNAALTGHLVLSTLHTNDAATALPRLIDMKVEPFLVASTINVIVAQRLVRKICDLCKTSVDTSFEEISKNLPPEMVKKHFGDKKQLHIYQGAGCKVCHGTGYNGRIGLFEVLEINSDLKKLINTKADSDTILKKAQEAGMAIMFDDGLDKVVKGITTIEEVLRVTKIESL